MVMTETRFSGVKPNFSSQRLLNLITGTLVWHQRLNLIVGWIFKLLTSGRVLICFLSVRITF